MPSINISNLYLKSGWKWVFPLTVSKNEDFPPIYFEELEFAKLAIW